MFVKLLKIQYTVCFEKTKNDVSVDKLFSQKILEYFIQRTKKVHEYGSFPAL